MKNLSKTVQSIKKSSLFIIKLILPLYIFVDILHYLGALTILSSIFKPIATILGLPPEASLSLAGGGIFNLYTGIALAAPLELNIFQWTIMGIFMSVFHSIIMEAAVLKKLQISVWKSVLIRLSVAFIAAFSFSKFFQTSKYMQSSGINLTGTPEVKKYLSFFDMLGDSILNASILTMKVTLLICFLIFIFDLVKQSNYFGKYLSNGSNFFNLIVGLLLGVTYGAGLLVGKKNKSREDISTAYFLMLCHGMIEETLLFTMFGSLAWPILVTRIFSGLLLSATIYLSLPKLNSNRIALPLKA